MILTGGLEPKEMVELVLHDSKFALVTSATSCEPFLKLNTAQNKRKGYANSYIIQLIMRSEEQC